MDWVVQLDCPEDGVTYVHRAGRTARYNTAGESLLVLLPQEEAGMLKQLHAHKVPIAKIEVSSYLLMINWSKFNFCGLGVALLWVGWGPTVDVV